MEDVNIVRSVISAGALAAYVEWAVVSHSRSTGKVSGKGTVGGLVGQGKTTAQMQAVQTFLDAGWDFVGETRSGTEDIWWIDAGKDYPRLWWEAAEK